MNGGDLEINYTTKFQTVTDGPWAGWSQFPVGDPYEDLTGQYYFRIREDGTSVCAFRAERKHMNRGGFLHGGCAMTFADYSLFVIAQDAFDGQTTVTATFNGELVGTAREGDLVECTGEVVKAGRSMVFVRGIITNASAGGAPVMSFSSVLKKTGPRKA